MDNKDILEKVKVLKAAKIIRRYCYNMKNHCNDCMFFECCAEAIVPKNWDSYLPTLEEVAKQRKQKEERSMSHGK